MPVDYTLYLVTDSTRPILGSRSLEEVVRQAIDGGVSIVQYRDKTSDTAELIRMGKLLHSITSNARIPLLINDRVDVAIAVDAEGVHLGQDDFGTCSISISMLSANVLHMAYDYFLTLHRYILGEEATWQVRDNWYHM